MKKKLQLIISISLMLIIMYFIFHNLSFYNLKQVFTKITLSSVFFAFTTYLAMYLIRAIRFSRMLGKKIPLFDMFNIVGVHTLFINLLPARLGELSYLRLIHKRGINIYKNAKSLLLVRVIDLFVLLLFFIILFPFSKMRLPISLFVLAVIFFIIFLTFLFNNQIYFNFLKKIISIMGNKESVLVIKITKHINELQNEFFKTQKKELIKDIILGTVIWFLGILFNYILIKGAGLEISLFAIFLISTIIIFVTTLPIYTPAGFGAVEGVWASGLIFYGVSKDIAIASSLYLHLLQLVMAIILGIICMLLLKLNN